MKIEKKDYYELSAKIISLKEETAHTISCIAVSADIAKISIPGQFITIQVAKEGNSTPVLRRPFAVSSIKGDEIEFIFNIVGRGTELLYDILKTKSSINILGPLGNGFNYDNTHKEKLLIAGGIGIAPLKRLADHFADNNITVTLLWGNRSSSDFFDTDHYNRDNIRLFMATDDGSRGYNGNVLGMLKSEIDKKNIGDVSEYDIFVVGPDLMMKAVADFVEEKGGRCQVSLETPMACGIGVCQGCAVKKRSAEDYYLVCKDGPVFYSDQIELN